MYAFLALILVLGALGGLYVLEKSKASGREADLAALQQDITKVNTQVQQLTPYQSMQSQRTAMVTAAQEIFDSRVTWSSICEEISLVIPENVRLTAFSTTVPATMLAGSALSGVASVGGTSDLAFEGETYSHKDVADFMTRLGLMPQITDIRLVSAEKSTADGREIVTFQITANLRPFQQAAPMAVGQTTSASAEGTGQ